MMSVMGVTSFALNLSVISIASNFGGAYHLHHMGSLGLKLVQHVGLSVANHWVLGQTRQCHVMIGSTEEPPGLGVIIIISSIEVTHYCRHGLPEKWLEKWRWPLWHMNTSHVLTSLLQQLWYGKSILLRHGITPMQFKKKYNLKRKAASMDVKSGGKA